MHDVVRHLALNKADKECFGKVYNGSGTFLADGTRRLSIQSTNIVPLNQSGITHLRAILAFTRNINIDLLKPILLSSKLLSTLDLQGTNINMLPDEVFSLFNLRFLGLSYTKIEILPEAVGRLQNLKVLDASCTSLQSLPKNVAKLKKLRHLYALSLDTENMYESYCGVKVARGIGNLTGLHALRDIKANAETLHEVAALRKLRTFGVCDVTSDHSLNLCSAIANMNHLVHLRIVALSENDVLPMEALCLPETLCKLELTGQLEKTHIPQTFSSWSHLNNLTYLYLESSKLDEDSFDSLTMLRGLCYLQLRNAYDGKELHFSAQSFPRLRQLYIFGASKLNHVQIEKGALESITGLLFSECPELKQLPHGIMNLIVATELLFIVKLMEKLMPENRANNCSEELMMTIRQIKKLVVKLLEENTWQIIH